MNSTQFNGDPVAGIRKLAEQMGKNVDDAVANGLPSELFDHQRRMLRGIMNTEPPPHLKKILERAQDK